MQTASLRAGLGALGAALGIYAIALESWKPGAVTLPIVVHVAVGWSFVAAGVVALTRRPDNRIGLLMTLAGIVWFGRDFDWFHSWFAHHASELSQNLFLALIAHQVVVFPSGVARSRTERALVAAAYALAILGYPPSEVDDTVNTVLSALAIALAVVILSVVVGRWLTAAPAERRALQPIVWIGPPVLVVVAVSIARDYVGIGLSRPADTAIDWSALAFAAIPVAFLVGVLRTRLRRALLGKLLLELAAASSPDGVRDVLARTIGEPTLDPAVAEAAGTVATRALRTVGPSDGALADLTARALAVLALIAEGRTDRGIASALYVTPKT